MKHRSGNLFHKQTIYFTSFLLVCSVVLSFLAKLYPTFPADVSISVLVQHERFVSLSSLFLFVSQVGATSYVFLITAAVVLFFLLYRLKTAALFIAITLINQPINVLLKLAIQRPRPSDDMVQVTKELAGFSFPSGHVMHFVVFYGFLLFICLHQTSLPKALRGAIAVICVTLILLIGPSRIFLGAHWFSDVLGGYIFGGIALLAIIFCYHKLLRHNH